MDIDLRYSCWTTDTALWKRAAPGALAAIAGLGPGETLTIHTAAIKEIRYGRVEITKTSTGFSAFAYFWTEWDEPEMIAETLQSMGADIDPENEESIAVLIESLPYGGDGPGVERSEKVEAATLHELLEKVDNVEDRLLKQDESEWEVLKRCYIKEEGK